jgi:hypothetical protein
VSGEVLTIRAGDILGNVLTRIDEIESRHLPHHEKDVIDADARCFLNSLGQAHGELAFLLPGSSKWLSFSNSIEES